MKHTSRKPKRTSRNPLTEEQRRLMRPLPSEIPARYIERASKMSWAPGISVEAGARYLMEDDRERAWMRQAYPSKKRTSRNPPKAKLVRFPEGVMTEADWVAKHAVRVEERVLGSDHWHSLIDRRKYNRMDWDEQRQYEARLRAKAARPSYRAWTDRDTFYEIPKAVYDSAPARLKQPKANTRLTESQRARLPLSVFVFPERRAFPLESEAAAYDAIRMLRLGRVKSASDFKAVTDAIRAKYPAVWKKYGAGLSWPKTKAAKALGSKHRAATVAKKKRTSRMAANADRRWWGVWTGKEHRMNVLAPSEADAIAQFERKTRGMVFLPGGAVSARLLDEPPRGRSAPTPLPHWKPRRNPEAKLDKQDRAMINESLVRAGLDGNGRFRSVGMALSAASDVLDDYGLEPDEVLSAWKFSGPSGHTPIRVAESNRNDPFSPVPVENSVLAFSWHQLAEGRWEAIAYMS